MSWLLVAIISYLLFAVVNLLDKFLLDKVLPNSKTYVFLVCLLGAVVVLIAPWFLYWPGWWLFIVNMLLGSVFALALYLLYESLRRADASKVLILIGGVIPVFSIILSVLVLGDRFSVNQWSGMGLSLLGIFIIAFLPQRKTFWQKILHRVGLRKERNRGLIYLTLATSLAYAVFFVGSKYAYGQQEFISSFIWIRLGSLLPVLYLLLNAKHREDILDSLVGHRARKKNSNKKWLVLVNQGAGATAGILQNYAIFLGPVAVINALQGVQYAFLLVLGILATLFLPKVLKEDISRRIVLQKICAIILISIGLYLIAI